MNRLSFKSLTRVLKTCHALWLPHRYHVFHGSPSKRGLPAVCWTDPRSEPWTEFSWSSVGDQMGGLGTLTWSQLLSGDKSKRCAAPEETQALPGDKTFYLFIFLMFSEHPSLPCDVLQPAQPAAAAAALVDVSQLLHIVQMDSLVWYKKWGFWVTLPWNECCEAGVKSGAGTS